MADLEQLLTERLAGAYEAVAGEPVDPVVRRSQHADFQSDGALALSRRRDRNPREFAAEVVARAELADLCDQVAVSGSGFINLTVADRVLGRLIAELTPDDRLGVTRAEHPETVVVDYSAPNAAKEMHVGHLRSTIIGDAVARLLTWLGHTVIRQNHIGDWGTPFGMLIEHLVDVGEDGAADELSVGDLTGFYQAARVKFDSDQDFADRARRRVVLLQGGDPASRGLWAVLIRESKRYFAEVYRRLDVELTQADYDGESSHQDELGSVIAELDSLGLLAISDGAACVFPAGFTNRDGDPLPLIVRKRDGGYGYATTDLATIRHRLRGLGATRLLYVVGLPQRLHLEMIYETAREAGWLKPPARAEHVGHGSVLGSDGKLLRTRAGVSVKLTVLLDEAVARAGALVAEKNPALDPAERDAVASAVGIGAVKYADLSTDRVKDYVFDLDRMLALDGNTAPYLQYAHARIRSIFRRAGADAGPPGAGPVPVTEPAERKLALELLGFAGVVHEVSDTLELHRIAGYLYRLASAFMTFYENCPVLAAPEPAVHAGRLVLCDLTARTLRRGLGLLGIATPDQM
ncbi:MAG: arginine--tRNA ligase [Actinomycetes bacterium]